MRSLPSQRRACAPSAARRRSCSESRRSARPRQCNSRAAQSKRAAPGSWCLPPYVYSTDWREMKAHVSAIISATKLSCMLYNNPPAYKTDFLPEQILELAAEHSNLHAVKESSGDARRVTAIRALLHDRLTILVGMDDAIVEGVAAGAEGWIAGLVNAFPEESVALFEAAARGDKVRTREHLQLVPAAAAPRYRSEVRAVHQVGPGGGRSRHLCRAWAAPAAG